MPELGPCGARWTASPSPDVWLDWKDGAIYTKNPDPATIDKMVALASVLRAHVQGDDGETYESGDKPPKEYRPSFRIDPKAMHGFGSITARYADGRALTFAMFAHNLRPLERTERSPG